MSTTSNNSIKKENEILGYWTDERKRNAKPKPLPRLSLSKDFNEALFQPSGNLSVVPPNVSALENLDNLKSNLAAQYIATPVATPASWPYSCNGKLFFKWKGGDYVGSAGSIYLEVLLTAGHNVYDEGEWSTDFLYDPGYPVYGKSWGTSRAAIFTAWRDNTNYAYDYAMLLTSTSMQEVGSMGTLLNYSPNGKTWTSFGYPARSPYPGNQMFQTTGSCVSFANGIIGMSNNDMTQGASGGNWWTNYNGQNYVNGVNSFGYDSQPTTMYGPYLNGSDFNTLLTCVATGNCQ